jgi:hypothetical protein
MCGRRWSWRAESGIPVRRMRWGPELTVAEPRLLGTIGYSQRCRYPIPAEKTQIVEILSAARR